MTASPAFLPSRVCKPGEYAGLAHTRRMGEELQ